MAGRTSVRASFTRPANTTAYTIGDVVSDNATTTTPMPFPGLVRGSGGSGYIVGAKLTTDLKQSVQQFRVHLFNAADATIVGDNVAWKELYADDAKYIGTFDLPAMTTPTDTTNSTVSRAENYSLRLPFAAAAGSVTIYAVLETLTGPTPASGQAFALTLTAEID